MAFGSNPETTANTELQRTESSSPQPHRLRSESIRCIIWRTCKRPMGTKVSEIYHGVLDGSYQESGANMRCSGRRGDTQDPSRDGTDLKEASQASVLRQLHLRLIADTNTCSCRTIIIMRRVMERITTRNGVAWKEALYI